jgi:drug/metabolite transporter (DMT)-like permease
MSIRSKERLGFLCLLGAIGLWSTVEVVTRTIHADIGPIELAWVRFLLGGVFLLVLLPHRLKQRGLRLDRKIVIFCLWMCWPGIIISSIALQIGLTAAGAAVVATVYGTAPLFVMGLSRIVLGDPMTLPRVGGLICGVLGIACLSLGKPSPEFSLIGVACALCAAASFSIWTVFVKRSAGSYAGLPVTALCCAFGVLFMTPLAWFEGGGFDVPSLTRNAGAVLYLAIGGTGVAYWLYFTGLEHVDATRAMSVILLKPPAATLLAAFWLGEPLTWNIVVALGLILTALYGVFVWDRQRLLRDLRRPDAARQAP